MGAAGNLNHHDALQAPLPELPGLGQHMERHALCERAQLDRDSAQGTWSCPKSQQLTAAGAVAPHVDSAHCSTVIGPPPSHSFTAWPDTSAKAGWNDIPLDVQRLILRITIE